MSLQKRKSFTSINNIYFLIATIHKWLPLLDENNNKQLIVDYLKKLSDDKLITIYAFVLMPNHIHIIWTQNSTNGKETPQGSFLKYTAHIFLKQLKADNRSFLYEVNLANKKHEIWQRDSLSIEIYSGKWQLAKDFLSYHYTSARFYEYGIDEFGFLHNFYEKFDGE